MIEQPRVALDVDREIPLVPERDPRRPVREGVGVHSHRGVQRRAHPRTGLPVPAAARGSGVEPGLSPERPLLPVRTRIVAARRERGTGTGDPPQARYRVAHAGDAGRIRGGADDHEVVVHEIEALDAEPVRDERLLGRLRVHEQHVRVAVARVADRLPGADRDHPHLDARAGGEHRQQVVEQARVPGRGRRLHDDELRRRGRDRRCAQAEGRQQRGEPRNVEHRRARPGHANRSNHTMILPSR